MFASLLSTLAQTTSDFNTFEFSDGTTSMTTTDGGAATAALGVGIVLVAVVVAIVVFLFFGFCLMKIFKKAGRQDAWAAFVPIYNNYVMFEVAGRPGWWAFIGFIPFVGSFIAIVTIIIAYIDLAKAFGKGGGFAALLLMLPVIGFPMLAFGDATYQGQAAAGMNPGGGQPFRGPTPPAAPIAQVPQGVPQQPQQFGEQPAAQQPVESDSQQQPPQTPPTTPVV